MVHTVSVRNRAGEIETKRKVDPNITTAILLQILERGRGAFGESAKIETNDAGSQHPCEYLSSLLLRGDGHPADADLRAKLAAVAILQRAGKKNFDLKGLGKAIVVTGSISTGMEFAGQRIKAMIESLNLSPQVAAALKALTDSASPFVPEVLDTVNYLDSKDDISGEEKQPLSKRFGQALSSGISASLAAFPSNLRSYMSTGIGGLDVVLDVVTSVFAILFSSTGLALEVNEKRAALREELLRMIDAKVMAGPPEGVSLEHYVAGMVETSTRFSVGLSLCLKALAVAAGLGAIPVALRQTVAAAIFQGALQIPRNVLYTSAEVISLNLLVLGARMAIPNFMTSDGQKFELLGQKVMEAHVRGEPLSSEEIQQSLKPYLTIAGEHIVTAMTPVLDFPDRAAKAIWDTMQRVVAAVGEQDRGSGSEPDESDDSPIEIRVMGESAFG
ncbi:hypothetical protein AB3X96_24185 [Paraburkholderia sp. BR13439]|uniref:hypothetical protein n=1 Tax=Paraburkholderia sp. BR13439 TaxID=3236996 RepID=UPI0034CDC5B5